MRTANMLLGLWLFVVLFAYFGVLKLTGILADLAMLTVLVIIAQTIWKNALRPLFWRTGLNDRFPSIADICPGGVYLGLDIVVPNRSRSAQIRRVEWSKR